MKNHLPILLFSNVLLWLVFALNSCTLYVSIEGKKASAGRCQPVPAVTDHVVEVNKKAVPADASRPKSNYQMIKETHNQEWLNLPHRPQDDSLFKAK